jgi:hypothetical protein
MNTCTRCGGDVPETAQACMHCRAVFTNTPEYQQSSGCALWVMLAVVVLSVILWALGWEPYGY